MTYSHAYVDHLKTGPFPGRVDPWAEAGRYFQQIHSGMIGHILEQIQDPLLQMGYLVGKETSLQVLEGREPDIFVRREPKQPERAPTWDYAAAASAINVEAGEAISFDLPELEALHVTDFESGTLVTVLEIISPRNKSENVLMIDYRVHRTRLLEAGVNVVEIDPTRSIRRLIDHPHIENSPYHTAVFLPGDLPRIIVTGFGEALKAFALPLRGRVTPVETHAAYQHAYRTAAIAGHILNEDAYGENKLPFPSTIPNAARADLLAQVKDWQQRLVHLRG